MSHEIKLSCRASALTFRAGERYEWSDYGVQGGGVWICDRVDEERAVVVMREPTRWESFSWLMLTPLRWIRRRLS